MTSKLLTNLEYVIKIQLNYQELKLSTTWKMKLGLYNLINNQKIGVMSQIQHLFLKIFCKKLFSTSINFKINKWLTIKNFF